MNFKKGTIIKTKCNNIGIIIRTEPTLLLSCAVCLDNERIYNGLIETLRPIIPTKEEIDMYLGILKTDTIKYKRLKKYLAYNEF